MIRYRKPLKSHGPEYIYVVFVKFSKYKMIRFSRNRHLLLPQNVLTFPEPINAAIVVFLICERDFLFRLPTPVLRPSTLGSGWKDSTFHCPSEDEQTVSPDRLLHSCAVTIHLTHYRGRLSTDWSWSLTPK